MEQTKLLLNMSHITPHQPIIRKRLSDFSIETLLRKDSSSTTSSVNSDKEEDHESHHHQINIIEDHQQKVVDLSPTFAWLNCSRFKPPRLPRNRKKSGVKRYGRGPRIPFLPFQIEYRENTFRTSQYLSSDCIQHIAMTLNLNETRVKIWFQNRRARFRREKEVIRTASSNELLDLSHHSANSQSIKRHSNLESTATTIVNYSPIYTATIRQQQQQMSIIPITNNSIQSRPFVITHSSLA